MNGQNDKDILEKSGHQTLLESTPSLLASVGMAGVTVATGIAKSVTTPTPMIDGGSTDNNLLESTENSNDNSVQNLGLVVGERYNNCLADNLAKPSEQKSLV